MSKRLYGFLMCLSVLVWFAGSVYAAVFNEPQMFLRCFVPCVMWSLLVTAVKVWLDD